MKIRWVSFIISIALFSHPHPSYTHGGSNIASLPSFASAQYPVPFYKEAWDDYAIFSGWLSVTVLDILNLEGPTAQFVQTKA